jgi:TM2 domain-containing membrane protein YozV
LIINTASAPAFAIALLISIVASVAETYNDKIYYIKISMLCKLYKYIKLNNLFII